MLANSRGSSHPPSDHLAVVVVQKYRVQTPTVGCYRKRTRLGIRGNCRPQCPAFKGYRLGPWHELLKRVWLFSVLGCAIVPGELASRFCLPAARRAPLDSEQFRTAPRTCRPGGGRLMVRRTDCEGRGPRVRHTTARIRNLAWRQRGNGLAA